MKTTINGYKLNHNGKPILSLSAGQKLESKYRGHSFKENGCYYFYEGRRGQGYLYNE